MELLWHAAAFVLSRRPIADWLIRRAQHTPYFNLAGYMDRDWLFNGYSSDQSLPPGERSRTKRWPRLPSIRVHHILREDLADHPHDHPWNARTIILLGSYIECRWYRASASWFRLRHVRQPGDTARIRFGDFHHIEQVSEGGVWTLFVTFNYCGDWGFLVDGVKVNHREYEARFPARTAAHPEGVNP